MVVVVPVATVLVHLQSIGLNHYCLISHNRYYVRRVVHPRPLNLEVELSGVAEILPNVDILEQGTDRPSAYNMQPALNTALK